MSSKWHGEEFKKLLNTTTVKNLTIAAITLQNAIKEAISEPSNHGGRDGASGRFQSVSNASQPGQPPHKDTGRLRASISHEVDGQAHKARVGTNVLYGKFLELGTVKMAARPFLRPTYERLKGEIAKILARKAT